MLPSGRLPSLSEDILVWDTGEQRTLDSLHFDLPLFNSYSPRISLLSQLPQEHVGDIHYSWKREPWLMLQFTLFRTVRSLPITRFFLSWVHKRRSLSSYCQQKKNKRIAHLLNREKITKRQVAEWKQRHRGHASSSEEAVFDPKRNENFLLFESDSDTTDSMDFHLR